MPEYCISLTRMFPYKDRIYDFVLMREIRIRENPYSDTPLRNASKDVMNALMEDFKTFLWHSKAT